METGQERLSRDLDRALERNKLLRASISLRLRLIANIKADRQATQAQAAGLILAVYSAATY